jgi:anti-sigma regulatory factor (Ser/Thr protein kinase)
MTPLGRARLPGRPALGRLLESRPVRRFVEAATAMADAPRLAWLSEADGRIGTTLDLERTARELADFTVPTLADGTAVDLLEAVLHGHDGDPPGGTRVPLTRAMAVTAIDRLSHLEPDPVGELSTLHPAPKLAYECLVSRRPLLVRRIAPDQYEKIAPTPNAARLMRGASVHSYMVVPLISRGVLIGMADFIRCGGRPPFSSRDLALACELAAKAAVFVDNARLYSRERDTVLTLQRALLPRAAPPTPGLCVDSSYRPAVDPNGVGGDWYDVVPLPGGRSALVVGDVMGHGLAAAATMGRLRSVARTLFNIDIAPERVLARLDLAARDLEEDQVATCLCALYDPAEGTYRMASAGHLPPLMTDPAGTAGFVDVPPGAPLGAGVIPYDPVEIRADTGSRLLMCTDGLVKDRSVDVDGWLDGLRRAADGQRPELAGVCETVWERTAGAYGTRDDDAIMLVAEACRPGGFPLSVWDLPADGTAAHAARRLVRERLAGWGLGELADATELIVSELVANALRYGNGPGRLRLMRGERLCVEVSDTGPDLPQIQHASYSAEGGRGLQLVNALCRRWGSCRTPGGKIVWAEQDLPG